MGAASGWFNTLRSWHVGKWLPRSGGRQPNPRVLARGLLAPIEAAGEGSSIASAPSGTLAIPNPVLLDRLRNGPEIGLAAAWYFYLAELSDLFGSVAQTLGPADRVSQMTTALERCQALSSDLRSEGAALAPAHATRIENYRVALEAFAAAESL